MIQFDMYKVASGKSLLNFILFQRSSSGVFPEISRLARGLTSLTGYLGQT